MAQVSEQSSAKTVLFVSGASKGIGLEFAKLCLEKHDNVSLIVGCRSLDRIIRYDVNKPKDSLSKDPDYWECMGNDGKINANWNDGLHTRRAILQAKFDQVIESTKKKSNSVDFVEVDINTGSTSLREEEKSNQSYANAHKSIDNALQYIAQRYGKIDILVNNAGYAQKGPAFDFDVVTRTSSINYYGTMYLTEKILSQKLLNTKTGRIVFVSSTAGQYAFRGMNGPAKNAFENIVTSGTKADLDGMMETFAQAVQKNKNNVVSGDLKLPHTAYGMSKAGVSTYSRVLARDLAKDKLTIGVGAYCPGFCQSYMSSGQGNRTSKDGALGIELLCFKADLLKSDNFWTLQDDLKNLNAMPWKVYMHM